jgi:hypothetical protein
MTPTSNYISREEVIKALMNSWCDYKSQYRLEDAILSLPTLPDASSQIREMVERKIAFDPQDDFSCWYKKMWEELLDEIDTLTWI